MMNIYEFKAGIKSIVDFNAYEAMRNNEIEKPWTLVEDVLLMLPVLKKSKLITAIQATRIKRLAKKVA